MDAILAEKIAGLTFPGGLSEIRDIYFSLYPNNPLSLCRTCEADAHFMFVKLRSMAGIKTLTETKMTKCKYQFVTDDPNFGGIEEAGIVWNNDNLEDEVAERLMKTYPHLKGKLIAKPETPVAPVTVVTTETKAVTPVNP